MEVGLEEHLAQPLLALLMALGQVVEEPTEDLQGPWQEKS